MADMRIAVIGAGGMAVHHLKQLQALLGEKPAAAICDIDRPRAVSAARVYGGTPYEDYALMFKAESFDAVFICTPPAVREDPIKLCARKGIPFFCEKSPALDLKTAIRTNEVVAETRVINAVGFMHRNAEIVDEFKKWFEGATITSTTSQMTSGLLFHPDLPAWLKLMDKSGGPVLDQAILLADLARYIGGEIVEVQAFASNQLMPKNEALTVPESAALAFHFASGAIGTHQQSWAHKLWSCQMEVRSGDSRVMMDLARNRAYGIVNGEPKDFTSQKDSYNLEVARFLEAVRTKDPSPIRSTYADAIKSLAVVVAANRALESGRTEKVKEV